MQAWNYVRDQPDARGYLFRRGEMEVSKRGVMELTYSCPWMIDGEGRRMRWNIDFHSRGMKDWGKLNKSISCLFHLGNIPIRRCKKCTASWIINFHERSCDIVRNAALQYSFLRIKTKYFHITFRSIMYMNYEIREALYQH